MKYEKGDKVVVEITEVDEKDKELTYGVGNPAWIGNNYILGKLEDFTKLKKIKFSEAEKKEFDELKRADNSLVAAFDEITSEKYPNLFGRLFGDTSVKENNKEQLKFARAWDKPSKIEVKKEKKYYVHLFTGKYGYLNKLKNDVDYTISHKEQILGHQTQFTKDEIAKIPQDTFKITDKALDEVEEDE